jgi:hypothetical protein
MSASRGCRATEAARGANTRGLQNQCVERALCRLCPTTVPTNATLNSPSFCAHGVGAAALQGRTAPRSVTSIEEGLMLSVVCLGREDSCRCVPMGPSLRGGLKMKCVQM